MEYKVIEIDDEDLNEFIRFPYSIYSEDSPWVPPLRKEYRKYITGKTSAVYSVSPNTKLMCYKGNVQG